MVSCTARFTQDLPLRVIWTQWVALVRGLSWPMRLAAISVALLGWLSQALMNFGINFFLHSFFQRSPNISGYFSNIGPAVVWVVLYAVPTIVYHVITKTDLNYLRDRRIAGSLIALGFIDSLGGFTSTYSTSHTPQFLQLIFISTGVMWTFGLTHLLIPSKARPLTLYPMICFILIMIGFANVAIPEFASLREQGKLADIPWWGINLLAAVVPVIYNVFSGRYMFLVDQYTDKKRAILERGEHVVRYSLLSTPRHDDNRHGDGEQQHQQSLLGAREKERCSEQKQDRVKVVSRLPQSQSEDVIQNVPRRESENEIGGTFEASATSANSYEERDEEIRRLPNPASIKMVMLTGDALAQVVSILVLFPLDFLPWFGSHTTPAESWEGLSQAWDCLWTCEGTMKYFIMYTLGFWLNHVAFAFLNHHSPTIGAFVMAVYFPVNLLLLLLIPRWNVWGGETPWYHILPCFVCLVVAASLYFLYEEGARFAQQHANTESTQDLPRSSENEEERFLSVGEEQMN